MVFASQSRQIPRYLFTYGDIKMSTDAALPVEQATNPIKTAATAVASAAEAVCDRAGDAAAQAKQALPAAGQFVSRLVYSSCYYVSYGLVFPTLFLANVIPGGGPVAAGLSDGASAAKDFVKEMRKPKITEDVEAAAASL
jgi:hypothetical protein